MTIRKMSPTVILLSLCVAVLCLCGGCLDSGTPVPSVSIDAATEGYGLMMSSTVGILLQPVFEGTIAGNDSYTWQCSGGQFLTWGAPDYKVTEHGPVFVHNQPGSVYWSPLEQSGVVADGEVSPPVTVTLQVDGSDGMPVAEAAPVTITRRDDGLWYTG